MTISLAMTLSLVPLLPGTSHTPVTSSGQDFEVEARTIAWEALSPSYFDQRWTLPETSRRGREFLRRVRTLSSLEFEDRGRPRRLGDLVREWSALDLGERAAWLQGLERRAPDLARSWGDALAELLQDDYLLSDAWRPSKDHARDGILMSAGWEIDDAAGAPWDELKVDARFEQAAVLFIADLTSIKEVENDYRSYLDHVGADYEEIFPVGDRHLGGEDDSGRPFRFLSVFSRSDLPFPFTGYECDLRVLNRIDEDDTLRTDIYSPSRDFHYLAGRDLFLPMTDSDGQTVAYLVVRDFGFDIAGVPDGAKHRREALRSTLGNLKRKVERRSGSGALTFEEPADVLPHIRVLGTR